MGERNAFLLHMEWAEEGESKRKKNLGWNYGLQYLSFEASGRDDCAERKKKEIGSARVRVGGAGEIENGRCP